jgi:hypothetical protein
MKAKAYWAGDLEAGGLIVAAETPAQARFFVSRYLFTKEDFPNMRARRVPAADDLIRYVYPIPHAMDQYANTLPFYHNED